MTVKFLFLISLIISNNTNVVFAGNYANFKVFMQRVLNKKSSQGTSNTVMPSSSTENQLSADLEEDRKVRKDMDRVSTILATELGKAVDSNSKMQMKRSLSSAALNNLSNSERDLLKLEKKIEQGTMGSAEAIKLFCKTHPPKERTLLMDFIDHFDDFSSKISALEKENEKIELALKAKRKFRSKIMIEEKDEEEYNKNKTDYKAQLETNKMLLEGFRSSRKISFDNMVLTSQSCKNTAEACKYKSNYCTVTDADLRSRKTEKEVREEDLEDELKQISELQDEADQTKDHSTNNRKAYSGMIKHTQSSTSESKSTDSNSKSKLTESAQ